MMPPSPEVALSQPSPAGVQFCPLPAATLQVPTLAPESFVQSPPQHSRSPEHTSPLCRQNEGLAEQDPFTHEREQHSAFPAQEFPAVLHAGFSAAQVPFVQVPPQHSALPEQALPSETH
jgi:hypothetical protein